MCFRPHLGCWPGAILLSIFALGSSHATSSRFFHPLFLIKFFYLEHIIFVISKKLSPYCLLWANAWISLWGLDLPVTSHRIARNDSKQWLQHNASPLLHRQCASPSVKKFKNKIQKIVKNRNNKWHMRTQRWRLKEQLNEVSPFLTMLLTRL